MHYVLYKMTWAEYQLRLFSYKRRTEREDRNFREVAFRAMWAFHTDPKALPKKISKYWKIGNDKTVKSGVSEQARLRMLQAQEQYQKEVNERKSKG